MEVLNFCRIPYRICKLRIQVVLVVLGKPKFHNNTHLTWRISNNSSLAPCTTWLKVAQTQQQERSFLSVSKSRKKKEVYSRCPKRSLEGNPAMPPCAQVDLPQIEWPSLRVIWWCMLSNLSILRDQTVDILSWTRERTWIRLEAFTMRSELFIFMLH